jgi:DNA-binding phage protein
MNIKSILEKLNKDVLSEETAIAIAEAFESAVNEKVESRVKLELENTISKIDEDHASKLEKLLEAIDTDHTEKLEKVVNALTEDHVQKLETISNFYKKALNEKADEFSLKLVEEVSKFLDIALEKALPQDQLNEAIANVYARKKLDEIRNLVGLDQEYIDKSIKEAIADGKKTIDQLSEKLNESYKENETLLNKIKSVEAKTLLDEKTHGMSSTKKEFIYKLLNDKESSYIQENFNYVVEMFERGEEESATVLVEEAKQKAVTLDVDVSKAKTLVNESAAPSKVQHGLVGEYLSELSRK